MQEAGSVAVPSRAQLSIEHAFPTADGGRVSFGPGDVDLELAIGFAHRNHEEGVDVLACHLRLRSVAGAWWRGEADFSPSFLSPFEVAPRPLARFEAAAPASWLRALAERPLLSAINDLWDGREHVVLDLGERRIEVRLKYQGPILDLALLEDREAGDRLVVRLSRLHDAESEEIAGFLYTLPVAHLLAIDTRLGEEGWLAEGELVLRPEAPR